MEVQRFADDAAVVDREGMPIGTFVGIAEEGEEGAVLVAQATDGRELHIPSEHLDAEASTAERVVVNLQAASLEVSSESESEHHATIPLAAEEMELSTRWVEKGRVIVRKRVETVQEEKTIELAQEGVEIERIPVNEVIDTLPQVRVEGETTIIPVVEEVLVVEKRYRLVEEVRVSSTRSTEPHTVREDLRREMVDFEEAPSSGSGTVPS